MLLHYMFGITARYKKCACQHSTTYVSKMGIRLTIAALNGLIGLNGRQQIIQLCWSNVIINRRKQNDLPRSGFVGGLD